MTGASIDAAPWSVDARTVATTLGTDPVDGLSALDAERRLRADGPNLLIEPPLPSNLIRFLRQFTSTMILVLLAAGVVTLAIGDLKDAVVIGAVVTLNASIGAWQEGRAAQAIRALQRTAAPTARIIRDGQVRTVPAAEIVRGDILHLGAGDVVAADARLIEVAALRIDEALLTGESTSVDKDEAPLAADTLVADRTNSVFKGTSVSAGRGVAIVTATGAHTQVGAIAELLRSSSADRTPLERRLAVLGRRIAFAAIVLCAIVFIVGIAAGEPASTMLVVAVSLAVAAIPESLPAVVTISLALGAQRMSRHRAIIRRLPAVETLGSVTVIATDKTGTLTSGRMQACEIWTADTIFDVSGIGYEPSGAIRARDAAIDPEGDPTLRALLVACVLCNDASLIEPSADGDEWRITGDPTEGALLALAGKAGLARAAIEQRWPRAAEYAFDARRKRMSVLSTVSSDATLVSVKGAPETLLPLLTRIATEAGNQELTPELRARCDAAARSMAANGFRVLAIAGSERPGLPARAEAERDLTLFGFVGLLDTPRPEAAAAVAVARGAGITPVMITGDHPETARAIADALGIIDHRRVMTGSELASAAPDDLAQHVAEVAVYARTTPEQKLAIVNAWKARGDIVAMTGDGINDAPAMQRADIGVAMGRTGTDVSKEAADLILADDNFATIVEAVGEGRRIYDNMRRFLRYGLIGGSAEVWVMLCASFVGLPLALLPAQILWINLLTHGLPGLALGTEPMDPDAMHRPPRPPDESVFARGLWQHVLVFGALTATVSLTLGVWGERTGRPWRTMIFMSLALLQLWSALAARAEHRSSFALPLGTNRFLALSVFGSVALQLVLPYTPGIRDALTLDALDLGTLLIVVAASTVTFWAMEAEKLLFRRRHARMSRAEPGSGAAAGFVGNVPAAGPDRDRTKVPIGPTRQRAR